MIKQPRNQGRSASHASCRNRGQLYGRAAGHTAHRGIDGFDVLAVVLLLATFAGVAILPFAPKKFGDLVIHREAKALALAVRGAGPWREVRIARAPFPVLYYAIPYMAVPSGADDDAYWRAAFIWTVIWMSISIVLVRRSGEYLGGPAVGKTAALLTLLSPFSVYYSYGILAETPAYLGVVLFTYAYLRWKSRGRELSKSRWDIFFFSLGLLIFVLSRPNSVLLLLLAVLIGAVRLWRGSSGAESRSQVCSGRSAGHGCADRRGYTAAG